MVDMSAISGALTAFNGLRAIGQAIIAQRDKRLTQQLVIEFQNQLIELQGKLMAATQEHSAMVQRVGDLEREIVDLKAWAAEEERYELTDMGDGSVAYLEKPAVRGGRPAHYLCANCYGQRKKSFLQHFRSPGGMHVVQCHGCQAKGVVSNYRPPV